MVPLYAALANGSEDALRALLRVGVDNDASAIRDICEFYHQTSVDQSKFWRQVRFTENRTLLSYLVENGQDLLIRFLLNANKFTTELELFKEMEDSRTALIWAAERDYEDCVRTLLDFGGDAHHKNGYGRAALSYAAGAATGKAGVRLIDLSEVGLDEPDNSGRTPLSYASEAGNTVVAQKLLKSGRIDINARCNGGSTPLIFVARKGRTAIIHLLLKNPGLDTNAKTYMDQSACLVASLNGREDAVRVLLERDADPNLRDGSGRTALSHASERGLIAVARIFLDAGQAEADILDKNGWSPLHYAIATWNSKLVQLFLETKQFDINRPFLFNPYGLHTPLSAAISTGQEEIAQLLLQTSEIDVNDSRLGTGRGMSLRDAVEYNRLAIASLLLATGKLDIDVAGNDTVRLLLQAANANNRDIVARLIEEYHVDPNARNDQGETALISAVYSLTTNDADIEIQSSHSEGATMDLGEAMNADISDSVFAVLNLLISLEAVEKDAQDNKGRTALHIALEVVPIRMVEMVVESFLATNQVNLCLEDRKGHTTIDAVKKIEKGLQKDRDYASSLVYQNVLDRMVRYENQRRGIVRNASE